MLCLSLKVMGLPTFLFYKDGQEVERLTGDIINIESIESALEKMI
jgi:thioredoxin 1